jgi:hypothetical protein
MSITIMQVRNAVSLDPENLRMNVEINHPNYGWIPYTVDPSDTDETIDNDAVMSLIGNSFEPYIAPTQDELDAEAAIDVRFARDAKLANDVDPIVSNPLRWNDLTDTQRTAWTQYRTDLLNIPQQAGFPHDVTWPTKPE